MKIHYYVGLSLFFAANSFAQQDCTNGRYEDPIFQSVTVTSDIQYGSNLDLNGNNVDLFADVYQPDGDIETNRPLIIFIHGGSFVGGDKTGNDVVPLAQEFAKKGYVTASISYRLGMNGVPFPGPGEKDATETVMRATQDTRAAIRFFRKTVAVDGNPYGIDSSKIFLTGVSAGGFCALHHAYLDDPSEIPPIADLNEPGLAGGLEGESGNPGYSSEVTAIVNIAGALGDVSWMQSANDEPLLSFHGDQDGTVPYGTDIITFLGIYDIMEVNGSASVHQKAEQLGMINCFKPHYGADHVPHVSDANYYDTTVTYMTQFLKMFTCGGTEYCYDYATMALQESKVKSVIFPNPIKNVLNIDGTEIISQISIIETNGRTILSKRINSPSAELMLNSLESGTYFLFIEYQDKSSSIERIIKE